MPARSQAQQLAAGAALSAKRGQSSSDQLQGAARDMFDSMTEDELEALASTKLDGLPEHAADDPTPSRGD